MKIINPVITYICSENHRKLEINVLILHTVPGTHRYGIGIFTQGPTGTHFCEKIQIHAVRIFRIYKKFTNRRLPKRMYDNSKYPV